MTQISYKVLIKSLLEDKSTVLKSTAMLPFTEVTGYKKVGKCIAVSKGDIIYTVYFTETVFNFKPNLYSLTIHCFNTKEKNSFDFDYSLSKAEYNSCIIMFEQEYNSRLTEDFLKRKESFTKELSNFFSGYNA